MDYLNAIRSKLTSNMWHYATIALAAFYTPLFALAQGSGSVGTILTLIENLARVVNPLIALLTGFAVLAFVRGIAVFIWNAENEEKRKEGRQFMVWGLVGMFVLVGFWGIIQIILVFYFGTGVGTPFAPPV